MFQLVLELSLLKHISSHLNNRLRLTADVLQTDAKSVNDSVVELQFPAFAGRELELAISPKLL